MQIALVTLSSVDDGVPHELLRDIAQKSPSVEFGILLSRQRAGQPRYPSLKWLSGLRKQANSLHLSAHLCGAYVEKALRGELAAEIRELLPMFRRVQFNFKGIGEVKSIPTDRFFHLLMALQKDGLEIIFQQSGVGIPLLHSAHVRGISVVPLYDASGGGGVVPDTWPEPRGSFVGYAGGLSPENLSYELHRIEEAAASRRELNVWIDAESGLRTPDDCFDVERAKAFLRIAEEWSQVRVGMAS